MQFFEYPYVIITIFIIGFIFVGAFGVYFALRGMKMVNGRVENDFVSIGKIGSEFKKSVDFRDERCVLYISISSNDIQDSVSQKKVMSEIEHILLEYFADGVNSIISMHGENKFIALAKWDDKKAQENVDAFQSELNRCLLEYGVLNIVNVRIGGYFALSSSVSFDEAIERAKQACLLAKNNKVTYAKWDIASGKELEKRIKIENIIEREIDNNRFFLEYQPVLDAKTKKIIGAEVLSRLNSTTDGVLAPRSFLSAVDSVGLNDKFDYYIFEKNCKWISNNKDQRECYKYTINFSRSTLCEPAFAEKIINIANKYDLKFSCLAVEVLEDKNITKEAKERMIENLSTLKEKGVSVLLDDFGSGYTTFDDLQNLDISIVKIDRAITQNSVTETGFIILENIIRTSKAIGYKTLCEGIETKEQEEAVIKAGCDLLQGYYYYKPMSVSMLENLFTSSSEAI